MIKKLQRKFVIIATASLFLVELIIIGTINIVNYYSMNKDANNLLNMISDNGGVFPDFIINDVDVTDEFATIEPPKKEHKLEGGITAETKYQTRYFTVTVDEDGDIQRIDTGHIAAVSAEDAQEYAQTVLESGDSTDFIDEYKYLISETSTGKLISFVDCHTKLTTVKTFLQQSCLVALGGLVLVFILITIFSRRAMRPVIESMEKQKQFITDAGHEIKTPLAIISANAEVIELTDGETEWTQSIRNQTKRLGELVKKLLTLSKMEEEAKSALEFADFNLSDAVIDTVLPFETLAQTKTKAIKLDVDNDININGDEQAIRQVVSILTENAIKYADENSEIVVSLKKSSKGSRGIKLSVFNKCEPIDKDSLARLFDRFYRSDSSRARETGGYGIGLSIARAIVEAHKGKITAVNENGGVKFRIRF